VKALVAQIWISPPSLSRGTLYRVFLRAVPFLFPLLIARPVLVTDALGLFKAFAFVLLFFFLTSIAANLSSRAVRSALLNESESAKRRPWFAVLASGFILFIALKTAETFFQTFPGVVPAFILLGTARVGVAALEIKGLPLSGILLRGLYGIAGFLLELYLIQGEFTYLFILPALVVTLPTLTADFAHLLAENRPLRVNGEKLYKTLHALLFLPSVLVATSAFVGIIPSFFALVYLLIPVLIFLKRRLDEGSKNTVSRQGADEVAASQVLFLFALVLLRLVMP
jgi:hypothetical protein